MASNITFLLEAKVQKNVFSILTNIGLCCNSVALNINFKSKRVFPKTKIYKKYKFQAVRTELKIKIYFLTQNWTQYLERIREIK